MLSSSASPDDPRVLPESVFSAACAHPDVGLIREWLAGGGDVNAREGARGWTLLMAAAVHDHNLLVVELLQRGASTEVVQHTGSTALSLASMRGSLRAVQLLVQAGADVNAADSMGVTPFMGAAIKGHRRIAEILLRAGARSVVRTGPHGENVTRIKAFPQAGSTCSSDTGSVTGSSSHGGEPLVYGLQRARRPGGTCASSLRSAASECSGGEMASPRPGEEEDADEAARRLIAEEEADGARGCRSRQSSAASSSHREPAPGRHLGGGHHHRRKNKKGRAPTV